jgi:hypothetical protein
MISPAANSAIRCTWLPAFDHSDWKQIERAFRAAPVLTFDQPWSSKREKGFRGGKVRIGWHNDLFLYFADLSDRDVITAASKRNDHLWKLGDVLEVFAGIQKNPAYIEYHTAPNGLVLQLFWPKAESLQQMGKGRSLETFMIQDDTALAKVRRTRNGWQVFGAIPSASVNKGSKSSRKSLEGAIWDLSFGRYDYASDGKTYMLSSTSPLTKAAFHRRHEWRQILFSAK